MWGMSGFMGYPQDWIRTLGPSLVDVHLKDIKLKRDGFAVVNLGEGDVDWAAVRQAFAEIAYTGSVIVELPGGDEGYLRDVGRRVDQLISTTLSCRAQGNHPELLTSALSISSRGKTQNDL